MQRIAFYLVLFLLLRPLLSVGQINTLNAASTLLKDEKNKFLWELSKSQLDPGINASLKRFGATEVDSIQKAILSNKMLVDAEKEKAVRSLFSFLRALKEDLFQPKLEMYEIPGTIEMYKAVLKRLLAGDPVSNELHRLNSWGSQLLARVFSQYNEYGLLNDYAAYKRISSSPEYIIQFLQNKPSFRFEDTLLYSVAAYDPSKMADYMITGNSTLQKSIRSKTNIYLRQILSLAGNRSARELLPFIIQLAEDRITTEEIIAKRTDVKGYYQLLVNTLLEEVNRPKDASFIFRKALRNGIKEKSFLFYVNQINELHSSTDAIRFRSVKGLRPEDLYYIITSCEEEMYTSSYLGLYKRLMENFRNQSADSLFTLVQYDNFRTFMRIAANYNTLNDFLNRMSAARAAELLNRFISGIETDTNTGLEKAMDIADTFTGLDSAAAISDLIHNELQSNLRRCRAEQQYFGVRVYSILLDVFNLVKEKDPANKLWSFLGNYEFLDRKWLQDQNGEINELVLFYGDEDGHASFANFLGLYKDTAKWKITNNELWVTIRSVGERPINVYANLPLDYKQELDLQAQNALLLFLKQQEITPTVMIHRGHSYHLNKTLKVMNPSVKLAILGSCGGYNSIISVATISPDAQIIVSKKTGSKFINDPMIDVINQNLLSQDKLIWPDVWRQLSDKFRKDEFTFSLFNEYIPPARNVSLFVLKLFNYYKKFA